jgi:hypothetical protein
MSAACKKHTLKSGWYGPYACPNTARTRYAMLRKRTARAPSAPPRRAWREDVQAR